MEIMDSSLDAFNKYVYGNKRTISEEILGKIAFSVSVVGMEGRGEYRKNKKDCISVNA